MPALSVLFFFKTEQIVLMALVFLLQRRVRKGNNAKKPAILCFFFVTERTQLKGYCKLGISTCQMSNVCL